MATIASSNIVSQKLIDVSAEDYEDGSGFFFHTTAGGNVKYCSLDDADADAVTKTYSAQETFILPEKVRKIFSSGTTATGIYVGRAI